MRIVEKRVLAVIHELIPPLALVVEREVSLGDLLVGGLPESATKPSTVSLSPGCL
jgi:hypothetical protein